MEARWPGSVPEGFCVPGRDKWKGRYREDQITGEGTKRIRREVFLAANVNDKTPRERRMELFRRHSNGLRYRPDVLQPSRSSLRVKAQMLTTQKPSSARAVRSHLKCTSCRSWQGSPRPVGWRESTDIHNSYAARATKEDRLSKTSRERAGNFVNDSDDPAIGATTVNRSTRKLRLPARGMKYEALHSH